MGEMIPADVVFLRDLTGNPLKTLALGKGGPEYGADLRFGRGAKVKPGSARAFFNTNFCAYAFDFAAL